MNRSVDAYDFHMHTRWEHSLLSLFTFPITKKQFWQEIN